MQTATGQRTGWYSKFLVWMLGLSFLVGIGSAQESAPARDAVEVPPNSARVYFGTYTNQQTKSEGIYLATLDLKTGKLGEPRLVAKVKNPTFLALFPNKKFLYAVSEVNSANGKPMGGVSAFAVQADGSLELLNQAASAGKGPCHLVVDPTGRNVLVANYGSGSVGVLPIQADGRVAEPSCTIQHEGSSVNPQRQKEPHAHSINLDPNLQFAFAADLGTDHVYTYRFDGSSGMLEPVPSSDGIVAPGSGPRHFAFHPNGQNAYVINELLSTMTVFDYDAETGKLTAKQTLPTLPADFKGNNSTAEVQVHPTGQFVYGSNRGHNSIVVFRADPKTGTLTFVEHESTQGKTPRNFGIDPTGQYLLAANQDTHNVVVFRIDEATGALTPTGSNLAVPAPVCVKFVALPQQTDK